MRRPRTTAPDHSSNPAKSGKTPARNALRSSKFGAFGGVFTPSLPTILGVIMFLRLAAVVGHAGLRNSLLILACAKAITLITAPSISSIATNMRLKGGGAYYLISRSLGVEFGGVIAVFFYVAQAVAVTLYVVGFAEAVFSACPGVRLSFRAAATLTNLIVFASVYIGAGWTIRMESDRSLSLGVSRHFGRDDSISRSASASVGRDCLEEPVPYREGRRGDFGNTFMTPETPVRHDPSVIAMISGCRAGGDRGVGPFRTGCCFPLRRVLRRGRSLPGIVNYVGRVSYDLPPARWHRPC